MPDALRPTPKADPSPIGTNPTGTNPISVNGEPSPHGAMAMHGEPLAHGKPVTPEEDAHKAYLRSRTFMAKMPDARVFRLRQASVIGVAALFAVVIPVLNWTGAIRDYQLNLSGKYLSLALVALGIDLIWGYTGLLSLCQALFFCIGGYVMAMHLSLPQGGGDVRPEYNNIPQFMFFNNVRELPAFWRPFTSFPLTVAMGLLAPAAVAGVFGFFILRSRVRGVYFSIITQALAYAAWLLISRNEMLLGGTNGLTNFNKDLTQKHSCIVGLYLLTIVMVALGYLLCRSIVRTRLGRVLVAVRDRESRLYFAGYEPYAFKLFAFVVAAVLAGVGGMLYSPQVTIISPFNMRVEESIFMVVWVAVGGRGRLWGAILGTLLLSYTESIVTSDLPKIWQFIEGGMALSVVLLFPDGFVGLWDQLEIRLRAGASVPRLVATAVPLAALSAFVLFEGLGLMPSVMRKTAFTSDWVGAVQLKYVVLILVLGACAAYQFAAKSTGRPSAASVAAQEPPEATRVVTAPDGSGLA